MFGFDPNNPFGSIAQPGQFVSVQPKDQGGGMFGGKKIGGLIAAALSGYLSGTGNPAGAQMLQMLNQRKQRDAEHQQSIDDYNRKRTDDNTDWEGRKRWELEHPTPHQPGEFETRLMQSGISPGSPEWVDAMKAAVQNTTDPVVMTGQGPMLRSQLLNGGQPAPPNITFTPIDGGQTPPASGGFPGY